MCLSSPALLSFQQLPVGRNLDVQGQLDVHELLVLAELPGQIGFSLLQSILQLGQFGLGILEGQLPTLLCLSDGCLKVSTLQAREADSCLTSATPSCSPEYCCGIADTGWQLPAWH